MNHAKKPTLKESLNEVIFETKTRPGKLFDVVLLWAIVLSVLTVMLESVNEIRLEFEQLFIILEWLFTVLFTIEYALRLLVVEKPRKYAFSFLGIIDLLALLPTYIALITAGSNYLVVIRTIRLLRIFRIFKLSRYVREATLLSNALLASKHKILVFLGAVSTLVMIMGTLMYLIEGGESGFTSIPRSIYWAIVTLTTVGYGDITPQTVVGQAFSSVLMLIGYAIIAVPTGIVTNELSQIKKNRKKKQPKIKCPECRHQTHDEDARYCKICGHKLLR